MFIVALSDGNCDVRYHAVRENEMFVVDDLDEYRLNAVMVFTSDEAEAISAPTLR